MVKENIVKSKSFQFAVRIVNLYKFLIEIKKEYVIAKQLLRAGTSIGANVREADNAQTKADFVHKLSIAQKECDETLYWLELLKATGYLKEIEFIGIYKEGEEILKIIKRILINSKKDINK